MSTASYILPLLVGLGLSLQGLRRRSLSPPGAFTAFLLGTLTLSSPLRTFGISLLSFYLLGSRATKVGRDRKQQLEQGQAVGEGRRGVSQVLVGGGVGVLGAVGWGALYAADRWPWSLLSGVVDHLGLKQRAFDLLLWSPLADPLSRRLIYLSLGHFATSLADTLASELGILSASPPLLITTLRPVPPGTNGGVSLPGTLYSLLGGLVMGLVYAGGVSVESPAARKDWWGLGGLILAGAAAGVVGSGLDSLLGATLQETVFDEKLGRVVTDEGRREGGKKRLGEDERVISGRPWLSNVQVNLVTSTVVGLGLAWLAM